MLRIHEPPANRIFFPVVFVLAAAWLLGGCVSFVRPVGEWARPANLQLHEKSLDGVRLSVRCGSIGSESAVREVVRERDRKVCAALKSAMQSIGAEVVEESASSDLTLWYLDRSSGAESCSALLMFGHVMSGYWIPCKSSEWSEAELRVADSRGVVMERAPLRVEKVNLNGLPFLISSIDQGSRAKAQQRVLQGRFLQYAQNRVYSQSLRLPGRAGKDLPWN